MSVFRHGQHFLQRRLTQLYTDTKSSCESISSAPRPNDDPELITLNRNFRTQKDRLLAWGLDWSDASAAQPNDIDEALSKAGFSDVVAHVMSAIKGLLTEAEAIQKPSPDFISSDGMNKSNPGVKTTWTEAEIARSRELLEQLTDHIETLFSLSRSRRDMSMNMASGTPSPRLRSYPSLSRFPQSPRELTSSMWSGSKSPSDKGTSRSESSKCKEKEAQGHEDHHDSDLSPFDFTPFVNFRIQKSAEDPRSEVEQSFINSFLSTRDFYIDRNALQISQDNAPRGQPPPPYELVATPHSRLIGQLNVAATSTTASSHDAHQVVPVLVEFSPIVMEIQNARLFPQKERLTQVTETLQRLVENAQISHLGLMKFVGYFVDMSYSRYAFVYQLPQEVALIRQPSEQKNRKPRPLASLFFSQDRRPDIFIPNLENRFRLAYNLVLSVLNLRSQNLVHGNINSHNILVFPDVKFSKDGFSANPYPDFVYPYLTSLAQFDNSDGKLAAETLSLSIYRHPDDHRNISDRSAWSFDLYSLGLVLLEIGLWAPLSSFWKTKYDAAVFTSRIEKFYVKKLGAKCGNAYLKAVQLCLDAPNFHVSTSPMCDLGLRIPKTFHYPWSDRSKADVWDVFSKNFVYTIANILFRCASLDFFSPPPEEDLEQSLPPPLNEEPLPSVPDHPDRDNPVPVAENVDDTSLPDRKVAQEKHIRKRTFKKLSSSDIPDEHFQQWNGTIMPRLSKLLKKVLRDSPESCSASLMLTGESAETARTTICVTCTSVKKVRAALKKYFDYDRENWDLMVIRGDVQRSKNPPHEKHRKPKSKMSASSASEPKDLNPHYQHTPLCGASIGAFHHDEHLPPVSYGGAVLVDGHPFGMTVHHMLDLPSEGHDESDEETDEIPRSSALSDNGFTYDWDADATSDDGCILELTDDEDEDDNQSMTPSVDGSYDDYYLSDECLTEDDEFTDDDAASIGDTGGIGPGSQPSIIVTQPALDDVEDEFFPCAEDRDEEHLASHVLGYVHASSGVRRWTRDGHKHEIDWALIKINDERLEASMNIVASVEPSNLESTIVTLDKVAHSHELGGLRVHCCGRTSGFRGGRINRALALVKLHGRCSFSSSYAVDANFGFPGDSGAWVFDKDSGRVCGHVLAWSARSRTTYIAPMELLFDDIARRLSATVTLPGSLEAQAEAEAEAKAAKSSSAAAATTVHPRQPGSGLFASASSSSPTPDNSGTGRTKRSRSSARARVSDEVDDEEGLAIELEQFALDEAARSADVLGGGSGSVVGFKKDVAASASGSPYPSVEMVPWTVERQLA